MAQEIGHKVRYRKQGETNWTEETINSTGDGTYALYGDSGAVYEVQMRALSNYVDSSDSVWSPTLTVTMPDVLLKLTLQVISANSNTIVISIDNPNTDPEALNIRMYYKKPGETEFIEEVIPPDSTEYVIQSNGLSGTWEVTAKALGNGTSIGDSPMADPVFPVVP